jgi:hypothetical protein
MYVYALTRDSDETNMRRFLLHWQGEVIRMEMLKRNTHLLDRTPYRCTFYDVTLVAEPLARQ